MRLKQAKQKKAEMDIIPMVDIVFQLIIFFLVATQVKKNDTARLTLPVASQGDKWQQQDKPPMILNILSREAAVGEKVYVVYGRTMNLDELKDMLRLEKNRKRWNVNDKDAPDPPVVRIRADEKAGFVDVQEALMACQTYQIWEARIVTHKAN